MRVIGYDPNVSRDAMRAGGQAGGIEKIDDLHALLAQSDVVSIHAVLNAETLYLIGPRELAAMKRTAFLINVSRGAIVDEAALVVALRESASAALRSMCSPRSRCMSIIRWPRCTRWTT